MRNLFLLVIVLGIVSATVLPVRERVAPRVVPMWHEGVELGRKGVERAGPYLDRLMEPLRRVQAQMELNGIADKVKKRLESSGTLPSPDRFEDFVRAYHFTARDGRDPWGGRYRLQITRDTIFVTADGPDGRPGTDDDLRKAIPRY